MFKMTITRKIIMGILIIIVLLISTLYIQYLNLKVYEWSGNLVTQDGITYQASPELFVKYVDGEITADRIIGGFDKIIGRFKEDKFLGFKTWVIKLKGLDPNETFLIRGLMFEAAYAKQHQ